MNRKMICSVKTECCHAHRLSGNHKVGDLMKNLFVKSLASRLMTLLVFLVIFSPTFVQGAEIFTETLAYDTEGLNLDSGTVIDSALTTEEEADIRFAYNALRSPGAVLIPESIEGVELAYLWGVAFSGVTTDSVSGLAFSTDFVDEPFSIGDTVVVRTDTGAVFKLGNATESETGVTFDYSELD